MSTSSNKVLQVQKIGFQWPMENPFLFCAHHQDQYPKGNLEQEITVSLAGRNMGSDFSGKDGFSMYHGDRVPGFPVHPHRGFETVTIVLQGLIDHFDSKGSAGRYGNGDVQWLTTGSGCQHCEMFPLVNQEQDNPLELFQIWLNLPAKDKFTEPAYKMLWAEEIPEIQQADEHPEIHPEIHQAEGKQQQAIVKLISGTWNGQKSLEPCPASWANDPNNHVGIFLIQMNSGATITLPKVSRTLGRNLYFYEGSGTITIEGHEISASNKIKLVGDAEIIVQNGHEVSYILLLEGEPIIEPVATYGPFVMNTEKEIQEAFRDYQKTQFGGWPWERPDPVHDLHAGRFARFADGTMDVPKSI